MERGKGRRRGGGGSKLCISVNMQLLTLINLPFSLLGGGGVYGKVVVVVGAGSTVIIYAHGCTPINCREGEKS